MAKVEVPKREHLYLIDNATLNARVNGETWAKLGLTPCVPIPSSGFFMYDTGTTQKEVHKFIKETDQWVAGTHPWYAAFHSTRTEDQGGFLSPWNNIQLLATFLNVIKWSGEYRRKNPDTGLRGFLMVVDNADPWDLSPQSRQLLEKYHVDPLIAHNAYLIAEEFKLWDLRLGIWCSSAWATSTPAAILFMSAFALKRRDLFFLADMGDGRETSKLAWFVAGHHASVYLGTLNPSAAKNLDLAYVYDPKGEFIANGNGTRSQHGSKAAASAAGKPKKKVSG